MNVIVGNVEPKKGMGVVITARAALQRINRKLSHDLEFVRRNRIRGGSGGWDSYRYWVIDGRTRGAVNAFDDVEEYARDLEVLGEHETVETEEK